MSEVGKALSREDVMQGIRTLCNLAISAHLCREVVEASFAAHAKRVRDALPLLEEALGLSAATPVSASVPSPHPTPETTR